MQRKNQNEGVNLKRFWWCAVLFLLTLWPAIAAPQAELWPRWQAHDPGSTRVIDHSAWTTFLQRYVVVSEAVGVNYFGYTEVSGADRSQLDSYIQSLEATAVSDLNRDEQLAFWVNLYNAVTIQLILDNLPLRSIRDIRRPWDTRLVTIENEGLTLNDVEHRILRPIWQDPRIHYVVNCASIGCPNLQPEAYTSANWNEMFERAAFAFINDPRGVRADGNRLMLSSLFDWYKADFGRSIAAVTDHLMIYARGETVALLEEFRDRRHSRVRYEYDWALNGAQ